MMVKLNNVYVKGTDKRKYNKYCGTWIVIDLITDSRGSRFMCIEDKGIKVTVELEAIADTESRLMLSSKDDTWVFEKRK